MNINEAYELCNYVANKNQSGNTFKPAQFNLLAKISQLEFIDKRLGRKLNEDGSPKFGYKANRKVDEDLRALIFGPLVIPVLSTGNFFYPYGYLWPDAIHKNDFKPITVIDSDEYPHVKHSTVEPPTEDYPILIHRGPYGFVDPYSIGSFTMTYVKAPPEPRWAYTEVNDVEVWDPTNSVDFSVNPYTNAHLEICCLILMHVGINLSLEQLTAYAAEKAREVS